MKVKVGDRIYDGELTPVMVILTAQDRQNIANMPLDANRYCCAPADMGEGEINRWMELPTKRVEARVEEMDLG